jgi:hypothetical protein
MLCCGPSAAAPPLAAAPCAGLDEEAAIVADVAAAAFLDESRRLFVRDAARTLTQLVNGDLRDCNRHHRLLLGGKGVGKSFVLAKLREAAVVHLGSRPRGRLTCVSLSFDDSLLDASCLVDELGRRVGYDASARKGHAIVGEEPTAALQRWLEEQGKFVFCTVDELQNVYLSACPHGRKLITQLYAFGNSSAGRIFFVLSGGSSDLRQLATGRYAAGGTKYPNYTALGLNCTKFVPVAIHPFVAAADFTGLVTFLSKRRQQHQRHRQRLPLWQLYLMTGGLPGAAIACLGAGGGTDGGSTCLSYSIST